MRAVPRIAPPAMGRAPPVRPVPAPRGTTTSPSRRRIFTAAAASSVERGRTTMDGASRCSMKPSDSYAERASESVRTPRSPTIAASSAASAEVCVRGGEATAR